MTRSMARNMLSVNWFTDVPATSSANTGTNHGQLTMCARSGATAGNSAPYPNASSAPAAATIPAATRASEARRSLRGIVRSTLTSSPSSAKIASASAVVTSELPRPTAVREASLAASTQKMLPTRAIVSVVPSMRTELRINGSRNDGPYSLDHAHR